MDHPGHHDLNLMRMNERLEVEAVQRGASRCEQQVPEYQQHIIVAPGTEMGKLWNQGG